MIESVYIYIAIFVVLLLGVSFWLFYISRVQFRYKLKDYYIRHTFERSVKHALAREERDQLLEAYIKNALMNLRSEDREHKFVALMQIHELSRGANINIKKHIINDLIKLASGERDDTLRSAVLDEICELNKIIKKENPSRND